MASITHWCARRQCVKNSRQWMPRCYHMHQVRLW